MAGLLDDIANAYKTAGQQLWGAAQPYVTSVNSSKGGSSDWNNALGMGSSDAPAPMQQNAAAQAQQQAPAGLLGPQGFGGAGGQDATAQQAPAQVAPAQVAPTDPSAAGGGGAANLPTNLPVATGPADVDVTGGQGGAPDQTGQAGGAGGGGLLTNIMQQAQEGAKDPQAAQGFFSTMADSLRGAADKMTNLSPAASQGLIAAGLSMLANNSGGKNLSQLVGEGGIAGVNQYQAVKQNENAIALKQQELAQAKWKEQQDILTARNKPEGFAPGTTVTSTAERMAGQAPQMVGGQAVSKYLDYTAPNGIKYQYPVNALGARVGPNVTTDASIPQAQQEVINKSIADAGAANQTLQQTQYYLNKIPTANIPGGLKGDFMSLYTKLGGDQTEGQALQQEIMRNMRSVSLQAFKSAVGNRVTQNEFNTMQAGLQGNLSGEALSQILKDYGTFQEVQAKRANATSEFVNENRGFMGSLYNDSVGTIGGQRYPAGTSLNDIVAGVAKPIGAANAGAGGGGNAGAAPSGGGNASTQQAPGTPSPAVIRQAVNAAKNGDVKAQAALKNLQARGIDINV